MHVFSVYPDFISFHMDVTLWNSTCYVGGRTNAFWTKSIQFILYFGTLLWLLFVIGPMENTTAGKYRHIQNCISNSFKRRFVSLFSLLARGERCYLWQRWWKKCKGPSLWVSYSVLAVWNKNVLYRRCVCVCVWVILLHMICVVHSFDCLKTEINQAFIYDFFSHALRFVFFS